MVLFVFLLELNVLVRGLLSILQLTLTAENFNALHSLSQLLLKHCNLCGQLLNLVVIFLLWVSLNLRHLSWRFQLALGNLLDTQTLIINVWQLVFIFVIEQVVLVKISIPISIRFGGGKFLT